ncbi:hypothetical protein [Pseudomonas sp. REB1044]|uniref:hypothetical protein n=1 Tax=Pseudomonas sp. REB1044 TaxID=2675224 RepID=UPI00315D0A5F
MEQQTVLIGWDVGGWNCERNRLSRDALVILDQDLHVMGAPWRGNLRALINQSLCTSDFIQGVLDHCQVEPVLSEGTEIVLAIDTPLGFSCEFLRLLTDARAVAQVHASASNPYLYRFTERFLFERGLSPLSAVKDMIGSQATKGMHVLARFVPQRQRCGVWSDGEHVRAIEAYPSAANRSVVVDELRRRCLQQSEADITGWHDDERDALTAALLAWLFSFKPELLAEAPAQAPPDEGWIFVPKDALSGS